MKNILTKKIVIGGIAMVALVVTLPQAAFAHVVVAPREATTGTYQTFTTSVPNEKDTAVTTVRLVIPDTIESVLPTVKPGWQIETKRDGERVKEIIWTGGLVPSGLRDEFTFSAHLPASAQDIHWKAYQTYQDGTVVSWDQDPSKSEHGHADKNTGPYSTTVVSEKTEVVAPQGSISLLPLYVLGAAALGLSVFAVLRTSKLRK